MFARTLLIGLASAIWAVAMPVAANTIDAIADRADDASARKDASGPGASDAQRRRSRDLKIWAIYGLGSVLRTDLVVDGELISDRTVGSELPHGLKVVMILPLEVHLTDGKKIIRLYFSASPQVSESEESRRSNANGAVKDGRSPPLTMPPNEWRQ